jgi:hypothetical protein
MKKVKISLILTKYAWDLDNLIRYCSIHEGMRLNRPPLHKIRHRVVSALAVLVGYADAVRWPGIQRRRCGKP